MKMDRRRVPRYSAHLKATLNVPGESTALALMVEDLCVLGCLLEYAPMLPLRQECEFALDWRGREFRTSAVVAWKNPHGQVGLEFQKSDPASQAFLREICADLRAKPLVRLSDDDEQAV